MDFYPRPPCGGRQRRALLGYHYAWEFLSTPSVWRATQPGPGNGHGCRNFYPRPPCGGRHRAQFHKILACEFLSTPSVWRATGGSGVKGALVLDFYPRPPCGGRRLISVQHIQFCLISIHALRVEGDRVRLSQLRHGWNFYPRPPCGGRLGSSRFHKRRLPFLSTPSVWRATHPPPPACRGRSISIHALRVEGDNLLSCGAVQVSQFLSTPSVWRATMGGELRVQLLKFLSTPSVWRATVVLAAVPVERIISIHALRVEGDFPLQAASIIRFLFLSTPSVWRATRTPPSGKLCQKFLSTPSVWRATSAAGSGH